MAWRAEDFQTGCGQLKTSRLVVDSSLRQTLNPQESLCFSTQTGYVVAREERLHISQAGGGDGKVMASTQLQAALPMEQDGTVFDESV